jgi:hypothetical protein
MNDHFGTNDPHATGDTGPDTQPGDVDTAQAEAAAPIGETGTGDDDERERAAYEPTPAEDERWNDFDETEVRARFLEHGDRADLLDLIDYRTR